jgi:uroporphyrinogen III methyltransferase/synthase
MRGLSALERADVVLYDALSHPALLAYCRADAELRNVGKIGGRQNPSQKWITDQLVELARSGKEVVRLKGGDSFLFARGAEEAEALADAGVPFEVVPGLSSPIAAAAYAGISLTHRDLSSSVTFITGTDKAGVEWSPDAWRRLATATDTICILMGMRRMRDILQAIVDGGRDPKTPAAVIQWGARPEQRVVVGTLATLPRISEEQKLTNPAVIIVGEVVNLRNQLRWYDSRPLFGKRVLVPRPAHQAEATAQAIYERAAAPVLFPVIDVVDPPDPSALRAAVQRLASYDWVLFTSANGVDRFFAELSREKLDARALGSAKLGVIGPKTADALRRYGVRPDAEAKEFTGEGLADALVEHGIRRALLPRALVARDALPEALRKRGAQVDIVAAYETRPAGPERALELQRILTDGLADVVLFTSTSTVTSTLDLLGPGALDLFGRVTVASIGPVTTAAAERRGLTVDVTAAEFTVKGLLDALEQHFAKMS